MIPHHSQFRDADFLRMHGKMDEPGVFVRDPALKVFLKSGPAVAATLTLLRGFLYARSYHDCLDIMEAYVVRGGDGGITRKSLLQACGLTEAEVPRLDSQQPLSKVTGQPTKTEPFDPLAGETATRVKQSDELLQWLLKNEKDLVTKDLLKRVRNIAWLGKASDRDSVFVSWATKMNWIPIGCRGLYRDAWVPCVPLQNSTADICPNLETMEGHSFPESYDVAGIRTLLSHTTILTLNYDIFAQYHDAYAATQQPKKGKANAQQNSIISDCADAKDKLQDRKATLNELAQLSGQCSPDAALLRVRVQYKQHYGLRTRRYACSFGAQRMSRAELVQICPHTVDLDIHNCAFTLLAQLLDRMRIDSALPTFQFTAIREVAQDRAAVCAAMGTSESHGKELLTKALNGSSLATVPDTARDTLKRLSDEGRALRWLATHVFRQQHAEWCTPTNNRKWPESTALHHLWTMVEDYVLEAWTTFAMARNPTHLSLHFDGIRIDRNTITDPAAFADECSEHIHKTTGYKVTIVEKNTIRV